MFTNSVALAQWVDVEEREGLVALKQLHGGNLPCGSGQDQWLAAE